MKRFLVIQHTASEFLGLIEKQLEHRGIGFVYCRAFAGENLPASALHYDALWMLGGAYPVDDREHCPWVDDELRLVEAFVRRGRPVVGIGFGGHVVARWAGATGCDEPPHAAYWTTAHSTETGAGDPVAAAVDGRRVLVMASGGVELPAGMAPVAVDERGGWIAVRPHELAYGLAFRPELKPGMIEDMIMEEDRPLPRDIGQLLATAREEWQESQRTTERVLAALVTALTLMQERRKMPVFALNPAKGEG